MLDVLLVYLLAGCNPPDSSDDPQDTDAADTDTDTEVEDTDVEDTDIEDTDVEDTDNPGLDELIEGTDLYLELPAGDEKQLWLRGTASQGHLVTIVAGTGDNGNAEIRTIDGTTFVGNGWCCAVPNRQSMYVPPDLASDGVIVVIRNTGDGTATYTVSSTPTGDARSAAGAVSWTPGADGWNQVADRLGLGEDRYIRVKPDHVGPYRFQISGPNDPVITAFTDLSNPNGSKVSFSNGECRPGTSGATCAVFLEKETWLKIEESSGDATAFWLVGYGIDSEYVFWADGSSGRLALPAGTTHHGWFPLDGDTAAQLTLVTATTGFGDGGFYDPDRTLQITNGFCCGIGQTQRYFLPPGRPWDAAETQIASWPENTEDLLLDFVLETVPDGTSAETAVPYTSGTSNHVLDSGEHRFLSWRATGSGTATFQANGMSWTSVKVGLEMTVYMPDGSTLATCLPTYETDHWETVCSFDATSGSTYAIELTQSTADDVMYAIWKR